MFSSAKSFAPERLLAVCGCALCLQEFLGRSCLFWIVAVQRRCHDDGVDCVFATRETAKRQKSDAPSVVSEPPWLASAWANVVLP